MGKIISGTFNGTGADLYVGLGFVPDFVKIYTTETTDEEKAVWNRNMRSTEMIGGRTEDDDGAVSPVAVGVGIAPYLGGDIMSADSTVYLKKCDLDRRAAGSGSVINRWTLDTPGSRTGHFNAGCNTDYIGEGSKICINGKWYVITALTDDGDADDDVTLNEAALSGSIDALKGMYDYIGAKAGELIPAGFFLDATSSVNSSGELLAFEAGMYD